jgi:hypothetical protein
MLANRTYFFNVKENRMGDLYLNIVESKNRDTGGFDRQSVILFADDLQDFLKGFDEALRVLEKEVREKRRSSARRPLGNAHSDARGDARSDAPRSENPRGRQFGSDGPRGGPHSGPRGGAHSGTRSGERDGSGERPRGRPPRDGKRVVVKKR